MDLKGNTIENWFRQIEFRENIFPHDLNYVKDYDGFSEKLNKWVHPYVNTGAMIEDGGCLTDHGPDHIKRVILRASELIDGGDIELSEYEIFVLLMAIHIHDVGNILGRSGHEINSLKVMEEIGLAQGRDRLEWDMIFDISEAHGGKPKDKISDLKREKILNHWVDKPRLAAILKFADELADDRTRTNRFKMITGGLPEGSVIYHKFAFCLHSVDIQKDVNRVTLFFDVDEEDLERTFLKQIPKDGDEIEDTQVYLLDEIYERTLKTHLERTYCARFLRPKIEILVIRVSITVNLTSQKDERGKSKKKIISYDLGEKGYPTVQPNHISTICPKLKEYSGIEVQKMITNKTLTDVSC